MDDPVDLVDMDPVECSICYQVMDPTESHRLDECGHVFHTACIMTWFRSKNDTCPLCRALPTVKLRPPDVMRRAQTLLASCNDGTCTSDAVIICASRVRSAQAEEEELKVATSELRTYYDRVVRPRKKELLAAYAERRREFKKSTQPILSELNTLDEKDRRDNAILSRRLNSARKRVRTLTRDLGLLPP